MSSLHRSMMDSLKQMLGWTYPSSHSKKGDERCMQWIPNSSVVLMKHNWRKGKSWVDQDIAFQKTSVRCLESMSIYDTRSDPQEWSITVQETIEAMTKHGSSIARLVRGITIRMKRKNGELNCQPEMKLWYLSLSKFKVVEGSREQMSQCQACGSWNLHVVYTWTAA